MRHLKPISRASMTWFEPTASDVLKMILSIIQALAPIVNLLASAKGTATT